MSVLKSRLQSEKGIILAADLPDLDSLSCLVRFCTKFTEVAAIKIGLLLGLKYGLPQVVAATNGISPISVIYNHQKAGTDMYAARDPSRALEEFIQEMQHE